VLPDKLDDEKANEESPPDEPVDDRLSIACHWLRHHRPRIPLRRLFFFLITFAPPSSSFSRIVVVIFRTFFRLGCR
jgi:hypothetical protein